MDLRKIKLALVINLLNKPDIKYPLSVVKKLMKEFSKEVGSFLSIDLLNKLKLNNSLDQETFELKYENLTVSLELVRNSSTRSTVIKDFKMK